MSGSQPGTACASCGAVDTLELDLASGTLACTRCGTVSSESSTAAFEFLARVDEEDEFANGRTFVSDKAVAWAGGIGASGVRALGGRAVQWASGIGERRGIFHAQKKKQSDQLIRRLLNRFDAYSRSRHAIYLFEVMKQKVGFRWGYRAIVYAAACVYVALRQQEREVWIEDLMDCCDEIKEPVDLARAIRLVKLEFTIYTKDLDPLLYVERALVHLQNVFRSDNPTYHVGNATKPFGVKNKKWIKGLSLERARTLAISLLSFSREICLAHGRSPEQVASAAVVVALEAIARKPCPKQEELDQELAWVTNTASFTIAERYREYSKALTTYAPQVPWIANSAKKWTKKQVVEHTTDIVQYWQARHGKDRKERERKWELDRDNAQNANGSGHKGGEEEAKEDDDDLERAGSIDTDEDAEVAEDESEFPPKLAFLDPLGTQTDIYRFARGPDQTSEIDRKAGYDKNAGHVLRRPGIFVRGSAEWTRHRAALDALSKGLGPSPSPSPFDAASPAPSTSSTRLDSPPLISDASLAALDPVSYAALATYGQKPDATRAQLAPTGSAAAKKKAKAAETRLSRLLWEKTAEEIEDAELFDDGELDSYVRTDDEANAIRQLPRYTQMLRDAAEQELKPKHPRRPPRRARGQPNPEYIALQAEAAAKGITVNRILTAREKRARGEESDGDDVPSSSTQPGFRRPRQKKTKVNAEAKARLLAALAKGSDDEDEAGEEGEGGSGGGWIGAAIDAAGQVDPAVAELAQPDEGDDDDEVYEGDDYWKKDFRLAEVDSDGYEDE